MPKKRVTKIDPREELSPYLNHQTTQNKNRKKKKSKVSASLSGLHAERKKSLSKSLGIILGVSILMILALGYYVSPLANVRSIQIKGASDLPADEVVQVSKVKATDKVFDYLFSQNKLSSRLVKKYPEVQSATVSIRHLNQLILDVHERTTIGYIKDDNKYRKILSNGKLGSQTLAWSKVDQEKPIFVGYNKHFSLKDDLELYNSFPEDFREQVKVLSGSATRSTQIILVMKDGNVIIGNIATLKDKIKYYDEIKKKAGKNSLIDLEVGAFSRPLTPSEKKSYGLS